MVSRYRRRGVGAALLGRALQEGVTRGAARIYCYVRPDNRAVTALCRKLGLTSAGRLPTDRSLVVLEKIL